MATLEARFRVENDDTGVETMEVWRAGKNDYWVNFLNAECSVRGTLMDVMNEIYSIYEDVEEVHDMKNNHIFEKNSKLKEFPELHRAIEKFEDEDWNKQWTFYCNAVDEYGDTYEIWIDGDGDFRWDVIEEEEDDDEYDYTPSATHGDYSPSCPWNAPGMSISDFI